MARPTTAPSTTPFIDYLKVPHLPRRRRSRPAGDRHGSRSRRRFWARASSRRSRATPSWRAPRRDVDLDLHRTDGSAGNILLAMELAGDTPVLNLRLDADRAHRRRCSTACWPAPTACRLRCPSTAPDRSPIGMAGSTASAGRARPFRRGSDARRGRRNRSRACRARRQWRRCCRRSSRRSSATGSRFSLRATFGERHRRRPAVDRNRGGHVDGTRRVWRPGTSAVGGASARRSAGALCGLRACSASRSTARRLSTASVTGTRKPALDSS